MHEVADVGDVDGHFEEAGAVLVGPEEPAAHGVVQVPGIGRVDRENAVIPDEMACISF